jgi:aryl-alcohol dehydrogenase-like predicted oxidoreductase
MNPVFIQGDPMPSSAVPARPLGSTGEHVSCLGVGGAHLGGKDVDEKLAIRIIRTAIDEGITFLDNSWDYHTGASERRMGKRFGAVIANAPS